MSRVPLVSVLLPVRDAAAHLPDAIASLEAQTLGDFEVVAVDDGSRDASPAILADWARRDHRVRVLHRHAEGIVAALEHARHAARAPILARMDADDIARPERLARQLALLDDNAELEACGCGVAYFPRTKLRDGARRYERWINALVTPGQIARDIFVECPIAHPSLVARAAAIADAGGYRDAGWPEDYDLVLRLWERGARLAKVPDILLSWRDRADRLSRTSRVYSAEAFRRCKVHYLGRTLLERRDGVVVWGAGPTGKAFARALARDGVRIRAFVELDPDKIGQRIHDAPVIAPADIDAFRGAFCVAAVAQPGAREDIRRALRAADWRELEDFAAVA